MQSETFRSFLKKLRWWKIVRNSCSVWKCRFVSVFLKKKNKKTYDLIKKNLKKHIIKLINAIITILFNSENAVLYFSFSTHYHRRNHSSNRIERLKYIKKLFQDISCHDRKWSSIAIDYIEYSQEQWFQKLSEDVFVL